MNFFVTVSVCKWYNEPSKNILSVEFFLLRGGGTMFAFIFCYLVISFCPAVGQGKLFARSLAQRVLPRQFDDNNGIAQNDDNLGFRDILKEYHAGISLLL